MREISIYTNRVEPPWHPAQLPSGLGGSEECIVLFAEALQAAGWGVTVYGSLLSVPTHPSRVTWLPREAFDPNDERDVLLTVKDGEPWAWPRRCRVALHWTWDVESQAAWPVGMFKKLDWMVVVSTYQAGRMSWAAEKLLVSPLGVSGRYVNRQNVTGNIRVQRAVYSSSPNRGLGFLLSQWPNLRKTLGATGLAVTYARGASPQPGPAGVQMLGTLPSDLWDKAPAGPAGVQMLGTLPLELWDRLLIESRWLIHPAQGPNGLLPDAETFGLNMIKAQALGCLPVVPREMVENSGWRDTVKRYIDLGAALREGDLTEHVNPRADPNLPLTWGVLYKRDWCPVLRGKAMNLPLAGGT